ncbi:ATP-binding protein [Radiobacillus kanasensis]|uniref:ATP-binding protein n=1 Tax=Radiobacillus kanasensis TaxID=2844358 RepID=UPI001E6555B1|nr:ATP-binding protein [Radiobacillus kanasensis]UFU01137.1 ATP-binding protein [Radiobacillus kanasensis]
MFAGEDTNNYFESGHSEQKKASSKIARFTLPKLPDHFSAWVDQHSFDVVTVCDLSGHLVYVSQSVSHVLGYSPEQLLGDFVLDYVSPTNQTEILSKIPIQTEASSRFHVSIRNHSGKFIWMETVIARLLHKDTNVDLYLCITRDITDKKEAEEMMIRSEKMSVSGQLAAGIAHEIRNPLTSLKGFVRLLQTGSEKKEDYFKIMIDEIEKMENITSELLFVAKPMTDDKANVRLSEMISDVITLLQPQANMQALELQVKLEHNPVLYCDKSQIKQVFINLIKNAIEAMDKSGVIRIESHIAQEQCHIDIIDEGPGIPLSIIHKVKEPFFTTKKDGTGLGLMICNQILEHHNGSLSIFQNAETSGSTFRVSLPVELL